MRVCASRIFKAMRVKRVFEGNDTGEEVDMGSEETVWYLSKGGKAIEGREGGGRQEGKDVITRMDSEQRRSQL